uniref:RdRp n=1 Tax=Hubei partiti-like virus 14 TaxID=1923020 RepID=A0A1L3KLJ0_9VIRU|nr:RdRp [Hubei partiti-like virus 14]
MEELPPAEGYALDARPPRWDYEAVKACNRHFGKTVVRQVLEKYRRAHVTLEALIEDVMEYNITPVPRLRDDPVYIACYESVRREFVSQVPIIPTTLGAVGTSSQTPKDKAPGLPWKNQGYKTKQDVLDDPLAMQSIRKDWILIGKGYRVTLPDCLVYARAQICAKDKNKVRATWGYPTGVFCEEARFVYPYLDFLKKRRDDYPLAYGVEIGKGGMGYIDDMFTRSGLKSRAVMMDWSKFDKQVPPWLIRDAFSIMYESFDMSHVVDSEGKVWPVNPDISKARWKKMVDYFINTPCRLPNGNRMRKHAGVPSGSCFTNIIDSIINALVTRYCMYHTTGSLPEYDIYMGDDSVVITRGIVNICDIADVAKKAFGFELNTNKSYVTSDRSSIKFLGYYNNFGYPIREQDFLLASFMLPEHVNEYDPLLTTARAVGQMWSTFNATAAIRWYELVDDLERQFGLEDDWFTKYMEEHPNRLKFLRLHGLEPTQFPRPRRFTVFDAPMAPPPQPSKRRPVRRRTDVEALYHSFLDDPPTELGTVVVEDTPPDCIADDITA